MGIPSVELSEDGESVVTTVIGGVLVLSLVAVVAFAIVPTGGSNTTEFYVLGQNATASEYPENITVGETVTLRVGIANHENAPRTYTLLARTNRTTLVSRTVAVNRGDRWQNPVSFAFESPGRKRVQLQLYTGQSTRARPYRTLQLFVTVRSS